jgi:LPS export ABC transporter protein LptC
VRIPGSGSGFTSAGLAVLTAALACGSSERQDLSEDENPRQSVEDFTLVQSSGASREWKLVARSGEYFEADSLMLLQDVEITFYEDDVPSMVMTGDSGRVDQMTGLLRLWGDVFAETDDGRTMEAPEIVWDDSLEMLHSDCLVVLTIPESLGVTVLSGRGVDLDTSLGAGEDVDIRQDFTAVYSGETDGFE